ncbi:MAG TPA: hypothetical protein VJ161_07150 [Geobacteraceae bacterium]|nr:hypothetical protein [Geobacteraceae bacterium]
MAEEAGNRPGEKRRRVRAVWIIAAPVLFLFFLYFAGKLFLSTPYATGLISGYLSHTLQQRVDVTGIRLSGVTLSVQGVVVSNPDGFPPGALLSARSLRFTPNLPEILTGKRSLTLLQIEGLKIDLDKNAAGEWNFVRLMRHLTRPKERPAAELSIGRLVFRDVSLRVGDVALEKLALTVNDLSTKGLVNSKLLFTGADEKGNPFRIAAEGRLGKDTDIHLSFDAPNFFLGTFDEMVKGKSVIDMGKGNARLSLAVRYRSGEAVAKGYAAFDHLGIVVKQRTVPIRGVLDFSAGYSAGSDEARLDRMSLVLNDKIRVAASGTVRHVKGEKEFSAGISCNEISLRQIAAFLPKETIKDMSVNGSVTCRDLRLAGNRAKGITSGGGKFSLRNGEAVNGCRTLFQGLSSDVVVSRVSRGWKLGGALSMRAPTDMLPMENLDARFIGRFSDAFRPLSVEIPALKAKLKGVPVHGELTFSPKARDPYRGTLYAKNVPLAAFNELIGRKDIVFSSGTVDLTMRGTGRGPASFTGELDARLSGLEGKISGKDCALKDADIASRFSRSGSRVTARGKASVVGGAYAGRNFSGSFAYSLADRAFSLTGGKASLDSAGILFADISGRIPMGEAGVTGTRYPLSFTFTGLDVTAGESRIRDVSGIVSAHYATGAERGRLTGNATLTLPSVFFRGRPIGLAKANVVVSGEGAVADVKGTAFDGAFSSVAKFDPFAPRKGVSFTVALQNARAGKLTFLVPSRYPVSASDGRLTMNLDGHWSDDAGLRCGIEGSANDLALNGKGEKTLVTGAGLTFNAEVVGKNVTVKEATIRQGNDVVLKIAGNIANAPAPTREGKFSFQMETAPVSSILGAVVNLLPVPLHQANGGGGLAMRGSLEISGGKTLLEGAVKCNDVHFDFPSQKVNITGVNGDLPFSVYLAGADVERPTDPLTFSKTNYKTIVDTLRRRAKNTKNGDLLQIGKVQFGNLEAGDVRLRIQARRGLIEISSIESSLYGGTVLGKGYMVYDRGLRYDADVLISDMSLRQFCNSYPALKGYISGLLDGIISLYGEEGGLANMVGFVDLWAHAGKGEKMLVSKEFLQRLAGKKLKGFFFRDDRPYDSGEIGAYLEDGYLTFNQLNLSHTNLIGMKDLNVSVAPVQNRIGLQHLFESIRQAAARGKPAAGQPPVETPVEPDLKWLE